MTDEIELVLMLDGPDGNPAEAWRIARSPAAVDAAHDALVADFRALSGAHGMAMEPREIRAVCWAPLASKLAALLAPPADGRDDTTARFADRALCYLVHAALGGLGRGERAVVGIRASGEVTVERQPRRLLHRNHKELGNHRREMERTVQARMFAS